MRRSAADIGQENLSIFLEQLSRESMKKRYETLNRLYQPAPAFTYEDQPYRFDPEKLEAIDRHRQGIIHRLELSRQSNSDEEGDLLYLEATSFYFVNLLATKHGIIIDPLQNVLDALGSKKDNPVQLAYEELLLATSLPYTDEKVWTHGGRVFATNGRSSRQLPQR